MFSQPLLFATLLSASLASSFAANTAIACNNSPLLCDRAYGNVTLLGAHDSAFVRDASTGNSIAGDQSYNSVTQLDAGVRLLTAQVHSAEASDGTREWHLCHSYCFLLDAGRLQDWLRNISNWMDAHPHEVVTLLLVNSDSASASDLNNEFSASGLKKHVYTPPSTGAAIRSSQWPSLHQMITANTRLVTFVANLPSNTAAPYLLDEFTYIFENPYDNSTPQSFVCTPDRPRTVAGNEDAALSSNRLFLMNHFLYTKLGESIEIPDLRDVNATNSAGGIGSLGVAVEQCDGVYGRAPWAVLVDFFGYGDAIGVVDRANGVIGAVGRTGAAVASTTTAGSSGLKQTATGSAHTATTTPTGSVGAPSSFTQVSGSATRTLKAGFAESAALAVSETGATASATGVRMSGADVVRTSSGFALAGVLLAAIADILVASG